ncbi:MAG TPA: hypothetical protein VLB76_09880 [Thermoanaerobaculia bacterium]|nr:hypothetical protein [Thermoanaerobaculia bacterium]
MARHPAVQHHDRPALTVLDGEQPHTMALKPEFPHIPSGIEGSRAITAQPGLLPQ